MVGGAYMQFVNAATPIILYMKVLFLASNNAQYEIGPPKVSPIFPLFAKSP